MKNLNKKNYFTEDWLSKYPKASKLFCDWVDKYKDEVGWVKLFNGRALGMASVVAPKFHDIPIEMQRGIIARFFEEQKILNPTFQNPVGSSNECFELLEKQL